MQALFAQNFLATQEVSATATGELRLNAAGVMAMAEQGWVREAYQTQMGSPAAKVLLVVLVMDSDLDGVGFCRVDPAYLAHEAEMTVSEVLRLLDAFRAIGLLISREVAGVTGWSIAHDMLGSDLRRSMAIQMPEGLVQ